MSIGERKQQPTYGFRATRFRMESSLSSSSLSMLFSSLRGLMGETRFSSSSFFSELEKGSSILRTAGISNNRRSSWIEWSGALFFTLCVFHLLFVFYSIQLQNESSWLYLSHSPYKPKSCSIVPKCALSLFHIPNKARLNWWWTESFFGYALDFIVNRTQIHRFNCDGAKTGVLRNNKWLRSFHSHNTEETKMQGSATELLLNWENKMGWSIPNKGYRNE